MAIKAKVKSKASLKQMISFQNNIVTTVNIKLECITCETSLQDEEEDEDEAEIENRKIKLAQLAYTLGWREGTSTVFKEIGIRCPKCHANRNNPKYFEY